MFHRNRRYAGSSFAIFETLKSVYVRWKHLPGNDAIGAPTRLLFGGVAGLLAQSLTYPLDIVRRRMQVDATGEYVPPHVRTHTHTPSQGKHLLARY
jgi:hypothetical protein